MESKDAANYKVEEVIEWIERESEAEEARQNLLKAFNKNEFVNSVVSSLNSEDTSTSPQTLQLFQLLIQKIMSYKTEQWLQRLVALCRVRVGGKVSQYEAQLPVVSEGAVIALPCDGDAPAASSDSQVAEIIETTNYYQEDEANVEKYLNNPFKVVVREGITPLCKELSQALCTEVIQPFLQDASWTSIKQLCLLVQLLDQISPSLYTYYLLSLFRDLVPIVEKLMLHTESLTKQHVDKVLYTLNSIADRWKGTQLYPQHKWEWAVKKNCVLGMLASEKSQVKLAGVKMLAELCSKCDYGDVVVSAETLRKFITEERVLYNIYKLDSHQEIIIKGRDILNFLSKNFILADEELVPILSLLDKAHEHVIRPLYNCLQQIGQKNLELHFPTILHTVANLPRPQCYIEQTFQLLQTVVIVAPLVSLPENMRQLYHIIDTHYIKMKKHIQQKICHLYFELLVMGIEENILEGEQKTSVLRQIIGKSRSKVGLAMVDMLILVMKKQQGKQIYRKCVNLMNQTIQELFKCARIYLPLEQCREEQIKLLKQLLDTYEGNQMLLTYQQLCVLINKDNSFVKYIQTYPTEQQQTVLEELIKEGTQPNNLISAYYGSGEEVREQALKMMEEMMMSTTHQPHKQQLAQFLVNVRKWTVQQLDKWMKEDNNAKEERLWGYVVLLKECVRMADQKGFGGARYAPFSYFNQSGELTIKVNNSYNCLCPTTHTFNMHNHQTFAQIIEKILTSLSLPLEKTKIKINKEAVGLHNLHKKLIESYPEEKQATVSIYEAYENQWFDKRELIEGGVLRKDVITALKNIYAQFCEGKKMGRKQCALVFGIAIGTEMSEYDGRINHLFTNHSFNGEYLEVDEWLQFYTQSAEENPGVVIDNLKNLGYKELFKNKDILQEFKESSNEQRQYIYNEGAFIYHLLFTNTTNPHFEQDCLTTLELLPVHPNYLASDQLPRINDENTEEDEVRILWYRLGLLYHSMQGTNKQHKQIKNKQNLEINLHYLIKHKESRNIVVLQCLWYLAKIIKVEMSPFKQIPKLQTQTLDLTPLQKSMFEGTCNPLPIDHLLKVLVALADTNWKPEKKEELVEALMRVYICGVLWGNSQVQVKQQLIFHTHYGRIFNNAYYLLSQAIPDIRNSYYQIQAHTNCNEYFQVVSEMLVGQNSALYSTISTNIEQQLQLCEPQEQLTTSTDQVTLGRLKLLNIIKVYEPELQLHPEIWLSPLYNKCYNNQTRTALYNISQHVCNSKQNMQMLKHIISDISIQKNSILRGKKHMGLYNLGCTCYLNSILQQLFMIECFRNKIMELTIHTDQLYFQQFQYIMYQLNYGQRQFFIPSQFCLTYTDANQQPINIRQQQDADEFLNSLFDRLENTLRVDDDNSIERMFSGKMATVITCQNCYQQKQRYDGFYVLTVEVKEKKNLYECLDKLVEPEVISHYFCQFCEQKVETIHKTNKFQQLPPYLFIHLQRLVFDLESLSKIKLDHPVQYPLEIDLSPYFMNQDATDAVYVLRGFLVHVGSSEGGHYYALVKEGNGWVKLDDSRVVEWDWFSNWKDKEGAYILIYERKTQQIVKSREIKVGNMKLLDQVKQDNDALVRQTLFLQPSFPPFLLDTLQSIHIPSHYIQSPTNLEKPYHIDHQTLPSQLPIQLQQAFHLCIKYILLCGQTTQLNIGWQYNQTHIKKITYYILLFLHLHPKITYTAWQLFLQHDTFRILYTHGEKTIRQALKLIYMKMLSILLSAEGNSYLIPAPKGSNVWLVQQYLELVNNAMHEVGKHYNKMDEYFDIVQVLCTISGHVCEWLEHHKYSIKLIHHYLQNETQLKGKLQPIPNHNYVKKKLESVNIIINILHILFRYWQEHQSTYSQQSSQQRQRNFSTFLLYKKLHIQRYHYEPINQILSAICVGNKQLSQQTILYVKSCANRFNHEDEYVGAYVHLMYMLLCLDDELVWWRMCGLLGVPSVRREEDMGKRCFCYVDNCLGRGDQVILPWLEMLFVNRYNYNYFTLLSAVAVLRLMVNHSHIRKYIYTLPPPSCSEKQYLDWMPTLLKQALQQPQPKTPMLNQIAQLLNQLDEVPYGDGFLHVYEHPRENAKLIDGVEATYEVKVVGQQQISYVEWEITVQPKVERSEIYCGEYMFIADQGKYDIRMPCYWESHQLPTLTKIQNIQYKPEPKQQIPSEPLQPEVVCQDQPQQQPPQTPTQSYECPFCMAVTSTLVSKCPTCQEDWGDIL